MTDSASRSRLALLWEQLRAAIAMPHKRAMLELQSAVRGQARLRAVAGIVKG